MKSKLNEERVVIGADLNGHIRVNNNDIETKYGEHGYRKVDRD